MIHKKEIINIRVTADEKEAIEKRALKVGETTSSYMRKCALGKKISTSADHESILLLMKMNADLARLGNLFRLSLKENTKYSSNQIRIIENQLYEATQMLKQKIGSL
ncbi:MULTISPECIES: plasmid mobilization protein [Vibrio]|uniref:plasmid mobilization protein n=1 Tax=Vibrio TaxID=662 RepID=UPI00030A488D|nr:MULTISPECIES: hypothetical protein [Vibrio]EKO3821453.1 hypothetical protein [Vibrio harveyi]